jgi:fimbrial isopeptide formation D2 family protein/LPXTG-motif cell wall-anchored protein
MKNLKKILALVVAMVMVVAMGTTAFAANTITITQDASTGTVGAESYNIWKIFDVTKTSDVEDPVTSEDTVGQTVTADDTGFSYSISTTNPWFAILWDATNNKAQSGQNWVKLTQSAGDTTEYNVTWIASTSTGSDAEAFAKWLKSKITSTTAEGVTTYTPAVTTTATSNSSGVATAEVTDDGYYLIDSTLGTNLVLATTSITINTKNEYPSTEKEVAKTNYNVGDLVDYTITVILPATTDWTKPVIVHDTMDDVLALQTTSVHAKVTAENDFDSYLSLVQSDAFVTTGDDAHDSTAHPAADGKVLFDFVLNISSLAPAANADPVAKTVIITYQAELLSTAAADNDLVNEEFVEYSEYKTPKDDAKIKTYDFDLEKTFTGAASTGELIATFNLYGATYTADSNGTYYKLKSGAYTTTAPVTTGDSQTGDLYASTTQKYKAEKASTPLSLVEKTTYESYVKADSDDTTTTTTISAKLGTTLKVSGLAEGTYYLTELTTADGYNPLTEDIVILIDADGNATVSGTSELFSASDNKITVVNNSGTLLPSTGGIGTTIFYIVGAILVIGTGVVLVTRKRMSVEK